MYLSSQQVGSDVASTKKAWSYATSKVSNSNPAQAAKSWSNNAGNNNAAQQAKNKVNSDVNAVKSWGNNAGNNVDNAAQQAKSKVSSDVNAVKSWGSSAGDAVAKNTPSINTPEVGGFFGTNPKQQADTINAKTAQKVCVFDFTLARTTSCMQLQCCSALLYCALYIA
jgi:hypothetical protein